MMAICFFPLIARQRGAAIRAGSNIECVDVIFIFSSHSLSFCQPMKRFEFFGALRATRQRHFKTRSTGDENETRIL